MASRTPRNASESANGGTMGVGKWSEAEHARFLSGYASWLEAAGPEGVATADGARKWPYVSERKNWLGIGRACLAATRPAW